MEMPRGWEQGGVEMARGREQGGVEMARGVCGDGTGPGAGCLEMAQGWAQGE